MEKLVVRISDRRVLKLLRHGPTGSSKIRSSDRGLGAGQFGAQLRSFLGITSRWPISVPAITPTSEIAGPMQAIFSRRVLTELRIEVYTGTDQSVHQPAYLLWPLTPKPVPNVRSLKLSLPADGKKFLSKRPICLPNSGTRIPTLNCWPRQLVSAKGPSIDTFPISATLFLAAADRVMRMLRERVDAKLQGIVDPLEQVSAGIRTFLAFFADYPEFVELLIQERAYFKDRTRRRSWNTAR